MGEAEERGERDIVLVIWFISSKIKVDDLLAILGLECYRSFLHSPSSIAFESFSGFGVFSCFDMEKSNNLRDDVAVKPQELVYKTFEPKKRSKVLF